MGNKVSKQQRKIQDFSFPFMDNNFKSTDDFKAMEEERNKALLDKKRFAVRLSDVEELYAKKCDMMAELEHSLLDQRLERKKLEDKLQRLKIDYKICQIERNIALIEIKKLQTEKTSMTALARLSGSLQHLDTQRQNSLSSDRKSPCQISATQLINQLISQLREEDLNLARMLQKLDAFEDEKFKSSKDTIPTKAPTVISGSPNAELEFMSPESSMDSIGSAKSIFPLL